MIDFFIVLACGIGLIIKIAQERRNKRENDRVIALNLKWWNDKRNELCATPAESEEILASYYKGYMNAVTEVDEALIRVYGLNYRDSIILIYKDTATGDKSVDFKFWLRQLLYAKHGKLDPDMWCSPYPLGGGKFIKINTCLCKEIESYLHKAGHTEMLLGSFMPKERIENPVYSYNQNEMRWLCPYAWGDRHRLW